MKSEFFSLAERIRQGDRAAFEDVYTQCQPSIYTYLFYRTGDQAVAEDLTSEVFVRMVEKSGSYTEEARPILAWLYTIARNLLIDYYRKNGQVVHYPLDERLSAGEQDNPVHATDRQITQACLRAALTQLTEEQRQVILLKFVEARSNADVGAILGNTEGAVKSLQHRALAALRRALERESFHE